MFEEEDDTVGATGGRAQTRRNQAPTDSASSDGLTAASPQGSRGGATGRPAAVDSWWSAPMALAAVDRASTPGWDRACAAQKILEQHGARAANA